GPDGGKRLVAYWVATAAASPESGDLRRFLKSCLPEYLVPAAFVKLERLPISANGKVDREALPEPSETDLTAVGYQAPRDAPEEALVQVWQSVLGLNRIGVFDNYFDLGGDSLAAIKLKGQVQALGYDFD